MPTPEVMELLVATPGDDITRFLEWFAANNALGPALAPALAEAVAKQKEITRVAGVATDLN